MNDVASLLLMALGRTTLWLATAAVVTTLVLRLARPSWPAAERFAWLAVLLVGWSFIRLPLAVPWYEAKLPEPAATVELAPAELFVDRELPVIEMAPTTVHPEDEIASTTPERIASTPVVQTPVENRDIDWPLLLLGAWALGGAVLVSAWVVGYLVFVRSLAARAPVGEIYQAEWHELLAGAGVWREIPLCMTESFGPLLCRLPRGFEIIVPESLWRELTAGERTAILRHELAHYQRGDVWTSLVARVLALPHWFNLAAWWAARQFDEAAEWACDRAAAGDDATTDYASALVRLGQVGPRAAFYGTAARGRSLAARIRRVLAGPSQKDSLLAKASLVAIVLGLVGVSVVQIELVAQQPASGQKTPPSQKDGDRQPANGPTVAPYLNLLQGKDEVETQPAETPATEAAPAPDKPQSKASEARAQKMVDKAREAFEANLAAYELSNVAMDKVYDWSMRWMRAAQIAAANDEENAAAIQAHLKRMQDLLKKMQDLQKAFAALNNVGNRGGQAKDMAAINFYVAEAERWLAEAETPATQRGGKSASPELTDGSTQILDLQIKIAEIKGEVAQANVDLENANRKYEQLKRANVGSRGSVPEWQVARAKSLSTKLDLKLATLKERLQLYEEKLQLAGRSPEERAALSEAAHRLRRSGPSATVESAKTTVGTVRFKDKDFDSWAEVLHNELSAERRMEAMYALATFGANGYGPQAAQLLLEAGRSFPLWRKAPDSATQKLTGTAVGAFRIIPATDSLPLVLKSLESEHAGERLFAVTVLPDVLPNRAETAKRLVAMLKDSDIDVRQTAANQLIVYQPIPPEFVATLRQWLASDDLVQVSFAAQAARLANENRGGARGTREFDKQLLVELLPDLLIAIERPEPYGNLVEQVLGYNASAVSVFSDAIESAGAQPGPRAQQLLEKLKKNK